MPKKRLTTINCVFLASIAGFFRLPQALLFHIEHFLPRSQGGPTTMANLVLSCPGCNLAKSDRTEGEDQSGQSRPLFNPRDILPRSPIGEASVIALRMNDPIRVFARKLQIGAGLIA